jgi:hypothetical protein
MSLTIDGNANSITSSVGGVNIPATVDTLSVGPSGSYMIANSSGVGIGTLTPQEKVHISNSSSSNYIRLDNPSGTAYYGLNSSGDTEIIAATNNNLIFKTFGTERVRIDSAGRMTRPYQPAFFASGNQGTITVAVGSYFPFNTLNTTFANSNRNGGYSTSTYLYTAPVTGLYQFYMQLYLNPNSVTNSITWWKNGTQLDYGSDAAINIFMATNSSTTPANIMLNGSIILELSANDTIGIKPRTGNPSSINFYISHSSFWGYLIG